MKCVADFHARRGNANVSKNIPAATQTIVGPVGVSAKYDNAMPAAADNVPSAAAPATICSGLAASLRAAAGGIIKRAVIKSAPITLMAAATTILGLAPLLQDAFFIAMAVTIMFGLGFATILTLIVVPVLYTIFYRVPTPAR